MTSQQPKLCPYCRRIFAPGISLPVAARHIKACGEGRRQWARATTEDRLK